MLRDASLKLCVATFVLVFSAMAFAQNHAHHAGKPRSDLGASAMFDPTGERLWAVYKEGGHVLIRHSTDFGRTWAEPRRVNMEPEEIAADGDGRPKLAIGRGGELYVTWTMPLSKPYTGHIRFARSLDGGASFSAPMTINADRQEITHRFDSIAVNSDGKVFVAWVDKRDMAAAEQQGGKDAYRGAAVYYAVSDDRGNTFRGDYKLADHSCECCRIGLLPREDGSVLAMWRHVFEPNIRDHALAPLNADGEPGKVVRATYDDWRVDACPHQGPSLAAVKDGPLHAVWFTQGETRSGVFYGRVGNATVEGLRQIGGDAAAHADVAVSGREVVVAWKEFDGERTQLKAIVSDDDGQTWREHRLASTEGASGQPSVLAAKGRFYVFWHTRQEPLSVVPVP